MTLEEFFAAHPRVAIAFSGGVDSSYLLHAAGKFAKDVRAYYVESAFQPAFELHDALQLAQEQGVTLTRIPLDALADENVASNPVDRCYFCKQRVFAAIIQRAALDGFTTILDGTNASDDAGDRPGMRALGELSVLSPLRLCGLTKDDIRRLSRQAGLFTWDKPAYACLATRTPTGQPITLAGLKATESAETLLFSLGFHDFRVRRLGDAARIQIPHEQMGDLLQHRQRIVSTLKADYSAVLLDLEARS